MSWTYSLAGLATTPLYQVRYYVGDTNAAEPLAADEEILFSLTQKGDVRLAAAEVCAAISGRFASQADAAAGDLSESSSQKAKAFSARAAQLRMESGIYALPSFGGLSKAEKESLASNSDAIQPSFKIGEDEYPGLPKNSDVPGSRFWWQLP